MKHEGSSDSETNPTAKKVKIDQASRLQDRIKAKLKALPQSNKVIDILSDTSCCGRCMLRFLGIRQFSFYGTSSKELREIVIKSLTEVQAPDQDQDSHLEVSSRAEEPICSLCVGTVQYAEEFTSLLSARLLQEGYIVPDFNLMVSLPTSTLIRHHAICIHLNDTLGREDSKRWVLEAIDIKEVFKLVVAHQIESSHPGLRMNFESVLGIQLSTIHEETGEDHLFLADIPQSGMLLRTKREKQDGIRKTIKVGEGRASINEALTKMKDLPLLFKAHGQVPPLPVTTRPTLEFIQLSREPVFVGGRYLKFSRDVSQTPWAVGKTKLAELSVSETISETIKEAFKCEDYKFVTAGREDANVRMLGSGRPFYIEMINARIPTLPVERMKELEVQINCILPDKVQLRKLSMLKPEHTKIIKEGEETKTKSYSALCWVSKPVTVEMIERLNSFKETGLVVEQQTPIRVLQRRAQMIRPKKIHSLSAIPMEGHFLVVHLHTEAGTYIKEFVHGDLGRNNPSLGSLLGCEADIMELDVLDVDLEFPPKEDTDQ